MEAWLLYVQLYDIYCMTEIAPKLFKNSPTGQKSFHQLLARRLAAHACTWHGPLRQRAMSTQKPHKRLSN